MQLIFEQVRTGGDRNFGYLLADRDAQQGVLIDPSYSPEALVQRATAQGVTWQVVSPHEPEGKRFGATRPVGCVSTSPLEVKRCCGPGC